jgi:GNAT superfamily N-acetyltransferase
MHIRRAGAEADWLSAERMLAAVEDKLDERGLRLWPRDYIALAKLKSVYALHELHFAEYRDKLIGLVFIQESDRLFWPEVKEGESLFFHKLAVLPEYQGAGLGYKILDAVLDEAGRRKKHWLRMDSDNRPRLRKYYEDYGFAVIDYRQIDGFNVVRYQMPVPTGVHDFPATQPA